MKGWLFVFPYLFLTIGIVRGEVKYLTQDDFRNKIFDYRKDSVWHYKGSQPCLIDFYTTWCGPCKRLAPIMEDLSNVYKGKVTFYKSDTERDRELAHVFGISSIPQVLYIPSSGRPMILKGLYPRENIVSIIDEFLLGAKKQ